MGEKWVSFFIFKKSEFHVFHFQKREFHFFKHDNIEIHISGKWKTWNSLFPNGGRATPLGATAAQVSWLTDSAWEVGRCSGILDGLAVPCNVCARSSSRLIIWEQGASKPSTRPNLVDCVGPARLHYEEMTQEWSVVFFKWEVGGILQFGHLACKLWACQLHETFFKSSNIVAYPSKLSSRRLQIAWCTNFARACNLDQIPFKVVCKQQSRQHVLVLYVRIEGDSIAPPLASCCLIRNCRKPGSVKPAAWTVQRPHQLRDQMSWVIWEL